MLTTYYYKGDKPVAFASHSVICILRIQHASRLRNERESSINFYAFKSSN
jgi:hypothetical protein